MAPPVAFLIPYFVLMSRIGLSGTYLAMILIMQTITIPLSVWLMKSFIDEVPVELEEAARVDGAKSAPRDLSHHATLGAARLIVTSMFAFVFSWNMPPSPLFSATRRRRRCLSARSATCHRRRDLDLHRRRGGGRHAAADDHLPGARPLCRAGLHLRFDQRVMMTKAAVAKVKFLNPARAERPLMASLGFENVAKRFHDGTLALAQVDLDIAHGEFMVLVGPSGCGKTTLLRSAAGLEEITSGEIRLGGRVVTDVDPSERDVAMVFQKLCALSAYDRPTEPGLRARAKASAARRDRQAGRRHRQHPRA